MDTTINILGEQLPIDIIEFKQFEIENVNYNKLVKTYENAINKMINEQRIYGEFKMNKECRTHSKEDELNWERDILPIYKNIISKISLREVEYVYKLQGEIKDYSSYDELDNVLHKKIKNYLSNLQLNKYSRKQILYIHSVCSSILKFINNEELFNELEELLIKKGNIEENKDNFFFFYVISKLKNKKPPKELENLFEQIRKELNDKKWW